MERKFALRGHPQGTSQLKAGEPALTEVGAAELQTTSGGFYLPPDGPWCGTHPPGWHPGWPPPQK